MSPQLARAGGHRNGCGRQAGTCTCERYSQIVRLHIIATLGRQKLDTLCHEAVQTLYAGKLASRPVEKVHVILHRALKMAVR